MRSAIILVCAIIAVQLAGQSAGWAYELKPISRVFAPSGSRATQAFEIANDGAERIALTISFSTLERDESYAETNRDAGDEFLAYPAQMILAPGGRQTVRVTWLGAPDPARELVYRIIVAQVPIEQLGGEPLADAPQGRVRVMLSYRGTLFIRPAKAAPDIAPQGAAPVIEAGGKRALAIVLANAGTAVGLVKSCAISIAPATGGAAFALSPNEVAALHNTRVLGGSRRRYVVPWQVGLPVGPMKATGRCVVEP
jgi:fimbrial chaperone protein